MPSVVTDPGLQRISGRINNGMGPAASVWTFPDTPAASIMNFQVLPSQPLPPGTRSATGLLTPDLIIDGRLKNFSPKVYDLSHGSALMHFMQALLGDSGVGQLLKRNTVSRLQETLNSTEWVDLDAFYGALFSGIRGPAGTLPQNPATGTAFSPYNDLASPDGWDQLASIDANFREKVIGLARAITLGATVPGLKALAEAVSGYKCHVYETWRIIDNQGPQPGIITGTPATGGITTTTTVTQTWNSFQATYTAWLLIPAGTTWNTLQGYTVSSTTPVTPQQVFTSNVPSFGGFGINCRNEIIIVPRRNYPMTPAGQLQAAADVYGITRVVEVLKPGASLLSVSTQAQLISVPVTPSAMWSPDDYWEIVYKVTPVNVQDPAYAKIGQAYPGGTNIPSPGNPGGANLPPAPGFPTPGGVNIPVPRPHHCRSQGTRISHVGNITAVWAQASPPPAVGQVIAPPVDTLNFQSEVIGGVTVTFNAPRAVKDPVRAQSARTASAVGVQASPYASPRKPAILAA